MTLAFVRWMGALIILLPFIIPVVYKHRQIILSNVLLLFLVGALSVAGFNTLVYIGLQSTTALNGTLMQSTMPIMILILSSVFLKEPVHLTQWLGVGISLGGVMLLVSQGNLSVLMTLDFNRGDLWIIAAMLVWAIYSIALRWKPKALPGFAFFAVTLISGVVILAPLSWWELKDAKPIEWSQDLYFLVGYLVVFPSILSYLFWNYGVERLGAQRAGLFIHLVPLWGMLLSAVFLGESIHAFHLWGMVLIFSGIYFAVISGKSLEKSL